jgi:division/cell wall cluster transcriptional repressor MraZ
MALIFIGNDTMRVDPKGRVGIPARFMPVLRAISPDQFDSVGLLISPERSIKILPMPQFIEEMERLNQLDDNIEAERLIKNLAIGHAELVALDKQNRIKLNPTMMDLCDIRQDVIVVGSLHYMQVFDVDVWKNMTKAGLGKLGSAMQKVAEKTADRENPRAQPTIKQFIINTADVEARQTRETES